MQKQSLSRFTIAPARSTTRLTGVHFCPMIMGFVTTIERYPDEKLLVVALSNLENAPVFSIGTDLAAMAKGEKYTMPGAGESKKVAGKAASRPKAGSQP